MHNYNIISLYKAKRIMNFNVKGANIIIWSIPKNIKPNRTHKYSGKLENSRVTGDGNDSTNISSNYRKTEQKSQGR